jgi:hypothetical protein
MLYHYTSTDTAAKICNSGFMQATHLAFVNDSREFRHGIELLVASLPQDLPKPVGEYIAGGLEKEAAQGGAFVTCLSRKADDLNQWRAYGGRSTGVMLGFDADCLRKLAAEQRAFEVMSIAYEEPEHRELLAPFVERFERAAELQRARERERPGFSQPINWFNVLQPTIHELQGVLPRIKGSHFREEQEIRLVVSPYLHANPKFGFRVGMGGAAVVPYVELDVLSALREVWIGPGRFTAQAVRGMRWLLGSKSLNATVRESSVPFRGW